MGFDSLDDLIQEITVNDKIHDFPFFRYGTAPEAADVWHSYWALNGMPGAGSAPASTPGTARTDAGGSIWFPNSAPDTKHILTFGALATENCVLMLYDRLVDVGAISIAGTGSKTVNSVALPRYATGLGIEAWIEFTSAVTAGTPALSMSSYTSSDGTAGRAGTSLTLTATPVLHSMWKLPLQAGDKGVRSVENLNVSALGTSGVLNVVLVKPLVYLPIAASSWNEKDMVNQLHALERIYDGASLALAQFATGTTATNVYGQLRVAYG